jgi:hypothetical protein
MQHTRIVYRRRRPLESQRGYLLLGLGYVFLLALTALGMTLVFA